MTLSFKQQFPWGTPTHFAEKIIKSLSETFMSTIQLNLFIDYYYSRYNESQVNKNWQDLTPKIHSIREDKTDRWHAGRLIHPVYNNRTPQRFQFAPTFECKRAEKDSFQLIYKGGTPILKVENKPDFQEIEKLTQNDGFDSVDDFFRWFHKDFEGKIIHFTDFKY